MSAEKFDKDLLARPLNSGQISKLDSSESEIRKVTSCECTLYRLCDNKANGQILRSATPILELVGQV